MKALKSIFICCFFICLNWSCSSDDKDPVEQIALNPLNYYEELNVAYGDATNQTFDLYLPANRTVDTKVMILVHGGGWTGGDKSDMTLFKDIIRQDLPDIAIVNINYRLATQDNPPYPMQIDDITSVVNYLKENERYFTISEDYGFVGVSAGAHLSMLWSYAFDSSNNVKMVCSVVGPTNFTDPAYLNNPDPNIQLLLALYGGNNSTEFLEEVSPYHQVTASAPPTILFYGGQDPLIPTTQGTDMRDRLQSLGVINQFTLYPNEGHGWDGLELIDTWNKLKLFTQTYLE